MVGTAGSESGEQAVRDAGAIGVVNHKNSGKHYLKDALNILKNYNGGEERYKNGFDVLLENRADLNLSNDTSVMARRGRILIVGSRATEIGLNPRLTMPNELDIRGVFLAASSPEEIKGIHARLYTSMLQGQLKPRVGLKLRLDQADVSHVEVMNPSAGGACGNIVVLP